MIDILDIDDLSKYQCDRSEVVDSETLKEEGFDGAIAFVNGVEYSEVFECKPGEYGWVKVTQIGKDGNPVFNKELNAFLDSYAFGHVTLEKFNK